MIWPFKRASSFRPEQRLWDHLDSCNIPFRASYDQWIDRFHTTPAVWTPGIDFCVTDTAPAFMDRLDTPMRAQVGDMTDLDDCPNYMWTAIQSAGDHPLNYARGVAGLTALFGKGHEASSSNTVAREWRFGLARVSCTVYPPDAQYGGPNERHRLFPETVHEAAIAIRPAWRPDLKESEYAACRTATSIWHDTAPSTPADLTRFSRNAASDIQLPQGFAITDDGDLVVIKPDGIWDIIPREQIVSLHHDRLTPARGGAWTSLKVGYACRLRGGRKSTKRAIASRDKSFDALDAAAASLAARLDLPLKTYTGPSD